MLSLFVPLAHQASAATLDQWTSAVNGSWEDASKWSGNVVPSNDHPQGSAYDVVIAATGPSYFVSLDASVAVNSITLDSSAATLAVQSGWAIQSSQIDVQAGALSFDGNSLTGARVQGAGSITFGHVTLSGVTFAATINAGGLESTGPLAFDGGTLLLGNLGGGVHFTSGSSLLAGTGTIVFNGATLSQNLQFNSSMSALVGSTLTLGSGITAITGAGDAVLTTEDGSTLTNNGTLIITSGHYLFVNSPLQNNGALQINGGTLVIGGAQTLTGLGQLTRTAGNIAINGSLITGGGTLDLDKDLGGTARLAGSTDASTITASNGSVLALGAPVVVDGELAYGFSTAFTSTTGITISTDLVSDFNAHGTITFASALTLNNHSITIHEGQGISIAGSTLAGTGSIIVQNPGGDQADTVELTTPDSSTLTIGSGITIRNDGTRQDTNIEIGTNNAAFDNQGIISSQVPNSTVALFGVNWKNEGTLQLSNGTLQLWGSTTTANLGLIVRTGGRLEARELVLDNTNATFTLDTARGVWNFYDGSIAGGTIAGDGGSINLLSSYNIPTLDGVTLAGDLSASSFSGKVVDGMTLDNATIYQSAGLGFNGTQTLGGTGTIWFTSLNYSDNGALGNTGALTIAPGVTIRILTGDGKIGTANNGSTLLNQGAILVDKNLFQLSVLGNTVTNTGTIAASNGGILTVSNLVNNGTFSVNDSTAILTGPLSNSTTLSATNSTLTLGGPLANTGAISLTNTTLILDYYDPSEQLGNFTHSGQTVFAAIAHDFGNPFDVAKTVFGPVDIGDGASFTNMTVTSSAGPIHILSNAHVTMNATIAADLTMDGGSTVTGDLVLQNATVSLNSGASSAKLVTSSMTGSGTVRFDGSTNGTIAPSGSTITIGSGVTVATGASGGTIGSPTSLLNNGTISARTAAHTLTISASTTTSTGTLEALNGGVLSLSSSFSNSGTLHAGVGSTIALTSMTDTTLSVTELDIQSTTLKGSLTTSQAALNGSLILNFLGTPSLGSVYTVLTTQSPYTGTFTSVLAPSLSPGMGVTLQYSSGAVMAKIVSVPVPEPSTIAVIGPAALLLLKRKRRRTQT